MRLILASRSPRRKELLSLLVDDFQIINSNVDEEALSKLASSPEELVVKLAQAKAKATEKRDSDRDSESKGTKVIIGADLTVVLEKNGSWEALGKPQDIDEARKMLVKLRGKTHKVFTGICVLSTETERLITDIDVSEVTFKKFSDQDLEEYLKTGKYADRAGAYGIQDLDEKYVQKVKGSYSNVIGLPLRKLAKIFDNIGIKLKLNWQNEVKNKFGHED